MNDSPKIIAVLKTNDFPRLPENSNQLAVGLSAALDTKTIVRKFQNYELRPSSFSAKSVESDILYDRNAQCIPSLPPSIQ
jgi:hypothetical protein